ncbi:MAG: type II toxin-antitoxin system VapC family toxin [Chloroflexi bacterium]|nr:type II toxin-antitoxin system VapC family toxin [Chloroflexota bacterium]
MTSSSSPPIERGLDSMFIVYSLLQNHPASSPCEQFLRAHSGWFTTAVTLLEVKAVLVKVYGVDPAQSSGKLAQFAAGPIVVTATDAAATVAAMSLADQLNIDLTDAVLLHAARTLGAKRLATDDRKLAQACTQAGISVESPLDAGLRRRMAQWEATNLPAPGLPRVLRRIHQWLTKTNPETGQDFWSHTGGGAHLP